MAHLQDIHPSIVKAVCEVQAGMEAVKKDQYNKHGGYNFASTDSIYAELTRRLAAAGLMILCLEDEQPEIKRYDVQVFNDRRNEMETKTQQWMRVSFSFVIATSEATWTDPRSRRSMFIQINGPQTFQAAQSYAEKSFMRSLFKIPTGDHDLDSVAQADDEQTQAILNGNGKRKSSAAAKRDGGDKTFNEIKTEIENAHSAEHLQHIKAAWAAEWKAMPTRWGELLDEEYATRMDDLRARAA